MTIDERIASELRRRAPDVDEHMAWERIQSAALVKKRRRSVRRGAASAVALCLVVLGFSFAPRLFSGPDGIPIVGPGPNSDVLRTKGDVLNFTGKDEELGDLVAVDPATGEERVLAADLDNVSNARWSADGRWVAFGMAESLWVVDATSEPRQMFDAGEPLWAWSVTGARLAVIHGSTLFVIDPSTGLVTELASTATTEFDVLATPASVTSPPVWSPDGTTIVFGARGGSIHSVDVNTGERSVFVQLPGEGLDSIDGLAWSPDGSRLAILADLGSFLNWLFVINADGSDLVLLADSGPFADRISGFDWSPDGSRIAYAIEDGDGLRIFVAPADDSTPPLVAAIREAGAASNPVWSPDGLQIAVGNQSAGLTADARNFVVDADGSGDDAAPLDDLTYESWRGGWYDFCSTLFPC